MGRPAPRLADDLGLLLSWGDGTRHPTPTHLKDQLAGSVTALADQFGRLIGAWPPSAVHRT